MRGMLDTCCPSCGVDFEFDLDGSWDDFGCPHCDVWLTLEVEDWVEWSEDGEVADDEGEEFTVERSSVPPPSTKKQPPANYLNEYVKFPIPREDIARGLFRPYQTPRTEETHD